MTNKARWLHYLRGVLFLLAAGLGFSSALIAQDAPTPMPSKVSIDDKGVDVSTRQYQADADSIVIGRGDDIPLVFKRRWRSGWTTNFDNRISRVCYCSGTFYNELITATVGFETLKFSRVSSSGVYQEDEPAGNNLAQSGNDLILTRKNGDQLYFDTSVYCADCSGTPAGKVYAKIKFIKSIDGYTINFNYRTFQYQDSNIKSRYDRLSTITDSMGYGIRFNYISDQYPPYTVDLSPNDFMRLKGVSAYNMSQIYCDPQAASCPASASNFPKLDFSYTSPVQINNRSSWSEYVEDGIGNKSRYDFESYTCGYLSCQRLIAITRPGDTTPFSKISYADPDLVSTIVEAGVQYNYSSTETYNTPQGGSPVLVGRVLTVANAATGNKIYTSKFDTLPTVTAYRDELGRLTSYEYDSARQLTKQSLPEGNRFEYAYDTRGNITKKRSYPKPSTNTGMVEILINYPAACSSLQTCNRPSSTVDGTGAATNYTYDSTSGLLKSVLYPAPATGLAAPQEQYTYSIYQSKILDSNNTLVDSGAPALRLVQISSCFSGASCSGTGAESRTTFSYGDGSANNLERTSVTRSSGLPGDPGAKTTFLYDKVGNVIAVDGPVSGNADTVSFRYDATRQLTGIIKPDPDGSGPRKRTAIRSSYNGHHDPVSMEIGTVEGTGDTDWSSFSSQQMMTSVYDTYGRRLSDTTSAAGAANSRIGYGYDAVGRRKCTVVRMAATQWNTQSDACSPQTTAANGPDRVTIMTYNAADEVSQITAASGTTATSTEQKSYTLNGKPATVTDANGNVTAYAYDGLDRLWRTCFQTTTNAACAGTPGDYEQLTYDANGNVTQRRLRDGQITTFGYDALNRMTSKGQLVGSTNQVNQSYAYDLLGNMMQASDSSGRVLGFSYDALGRKTAQTDSLYSYGNASFQYDAAGHRTRFAFNDGMYVSYDYFDNGAPKTIRDSAGNALVTFGYDDLGRRTSLTRANGTVTGYSYDPASRLSQLTQDLAGTGYDLTLAFGYNPAKQVTSRTSSNDNYAWTGHYNVDRSYGVNGLNQLNPAGSTALGYDARGNLTTSGSTTYTYNIDNQLVTATGVNASLRYDPMGRLTYGRFATNAPLTSLSYDGSNVIAEMDPGAGTLLRRYIYGPGIDEPLIWYESGDATRRWMHADERGSIVAVTNDTGTAMGLNRYDEYGIPAAGNITSALHYTGQKWLPAFGLYYYKARMYSPTLGRFMQTDPIGYGDGPNWYNYVGSDPVNATDSTGTQDDGAPTTLPSGTVPEVVGAEVVVTAIRSLPSFDVKASTYNLTTPTITGMNISSAPPSISLGQGLPQNDGSILEQQGRRNGTGKRGEAGKNPNPDKHGPKRAFGKPGYVTDEGRDGQRGRPRPARPGEPGYGEGGLNFSARDALVGAGVVVFVGGAAVLLAPEVATAVAAAGLVSLFVN